MKKHVDKILELTMELKDEWPIFVSQDGLFHKLPFEIAKRATSWGYGIKPAYYSNQSYKVFYLTKDIIKWLEKEVKNV